MVGLLANVAAALLLARASFVAKPGEFCVCPGDFGPLCARHSAIPVHVIMSPSFRAALYPASHKESERHQEVSKGKPPDANSGLEDSPKARQLPTAEAIAMAL